MWDQDDLKKKSAKNEQAFQIIQAKPIASRSESEPCACA